MRSLLLAGLLVGLAGCVMPIPLPGGATGTPGSGTGTSEGAPGGTDAGPGDRTSSCPATPGQLVLERVNAIRQQRGLAPLDADARLVEAAQAHTRYQADRGTISHRGEDGSSAGDRLTAVGYPWVLVSENVGAGYPTAANMVDGWMGSSGHRRTILTANAVHAGVGYVRGGGRTPHYWTLKVAAPRVPSDASGAERQRVLGERVLSCHP
ncbi:MAG TPA: CAP domain-containing protein [Longimicrobiales bacterium]|nr:CAP domain-containing protein [Longimicrobiales bacterium]